MQSLLRWSIEHSGADGSAPQDGQGGQQPEPKKLDPEIIDMILGKPDSEQMKEKLAIAVDQNRSEEERVQALDDFEMLIESIDNANDLEKLKMWQPLYDLLTSPGSTDEIKRQVLWVIGTAVQNNPAAQNVFLSIISVQTILSFLAPSVPAQTRSKAVYALSGILKHNASAMRQLDTMNGWETIRNALEDSDITVRRKMAFLINALLIPSSTPPPQIQAPSNPGPASSASSSTSLTLHPSSTSPSPALHTPASPSAPVHPNSHASLLTDPYSLDTSSLAFVAMRAKGILPVLIGGLTAPVPHGEDGEVEGDLDFEEKVVRLLYTYVSGCRGTFTGEERQRLSEYFERSGRDGERHGLGEEEMEALLRAIE